MSIEEALTLRAYAKINLTLDVLGRRDDGYHEVASVMQTIELADNISFTPHHEIHLFCDVPELDSHENLVVKAAELLKRESGYKGGARITLAKMIPVAGGLGGGSSDAAVTLKGLNSLWELGLTQDALLTLAVRLGSDVPFFLYGGTALVEGSGERITPLPSFPQSWFVLLRRSHNIAQKTKTLYEALQAHHFSQGESTLKLVEALRADANIPSSIFYNAFEWVAFDVYPDLLESCSRFLDAGATWIHLVGAGPTLYTMMDEKEQAKELKQRLEEKGLEAYLAQACGEG